MGKTGGLFPARNQTDAVTIPFFTSCKLSDEQAAEFLNPFLAAGIRNGVMQLARVGIQTEVLFLSGMGKPDIFVMFRDNEMVSGAGGTFFTGMLSVNVIVHLVCFSP